MTDVEILRIGHRPERDQRVTTHVGLTARALGARGMLLAGRDSGVVKSIRDVAERWGGSFWIEDQISWKRCILDWKDAGGVVVHLTMYGERLQDRQDEIRRKDRILVVVGAEKVPGEVFGLADYNISVTSQPHSEISSLAVFLDHVFQGRELETTFPDAKIRVIPSREGKITEER
ncbi:MAG: tRNA (cytidine(56)-2'-O)-methyltransferase [Methanolinea sp.]|nr:tRNA (cytidine(56)-2'-O)-methyltransferase [Methanolinea sp.]